MLVIYSPLLLITAYVETQAAYKVRHNRRHGEEDDDTTEEWEQFNDGNGIDFEGEGWTKKVEGTKPNVEIDVAVIEIRELREEMKALRVLVEGLKSEKENGDL